MRMLSEDDFSLTPMNHSITLSHRLDEDSIIALHGWKKMAS